VKTILAILVLMIPFGHFIATGFASLTIPSESDLATAGGIKLSPATRPSLSDGEITRRIDAFQRVATPQQYDCDAFAKILGTGVEPAFNFVRDRVRFESYTGELRGAHGTFDARAGNAIDRALLLAHLLADKGINRRYVQGELDQQHAEMLLARMFGAPVAPAQTPAEGIERQLQQRGVRDYAILRPNLAKDLTCTVPTHEELLAEVRQHTWLQAEIDGKWIDLDPSFADARPGQAFCAVQRQFDGVGDELCQQVAIRVVAETLGNGELKSKTVLDFTAPADGLLDRQIFFTQIPSKPADVAGGLAAGISADSGDSWTPVLWVAGKTQAGTPVVFQEQPAKSDRGAPIGGGFGGMFGGGGALAGGGSVIVAETLEFEIRFPDGRKDLSRRVLFDRAGAAMRAGHSFDPDKLQPMARDDNGLNAPRQLLNIWFTAGGHNLAEYAQAGQWLASYDGSIDAKSPFGWRVWPMAIRTFALPVVSDDLIVQALNDRPDVRFYADSPRIMIVTVSNDSKLGRSFSVDLRRDHLRAVSRDDSGRPAAAQRKLWFAVLESALEHTIAERDATDAGIDPAVVASCSSLLDGGTVAVVRQSSDVDAVSGDPDVRQTLRDRIGQGAVILYPRQQLAAAPAGWWEVGAGGDVASVWNGLYGGGYGKGYGNGPSGGYNNGHFNPDNVSHSPENPGHLPDENFPGGRPPNRPTQYNPENLKKFRQQNPKNRNLAPQEQDPEEEEGGTEYEAMKREGETQVSIEGAEYAPLLGEDVEQIEVDIFDDLAEITQITRIPPP